jgi:hypothetical protein
MAIGKTAEEDRRRAVRFSCGGQAQVSPLPSNGIFMPGTIRDLSLHGCWVEIPRPIDCGVRAEILVRVNAASFRAVGEVRAVRGQSGAGLEFVQLSSGGKDLLADLISQLARLQALMNKLKSDRRRMDEESFRKELEAGKLEAIALSKRFPFLGTTLSAMNLEEGKTESGGELVSTGGHEVVPVNLFG